MKVCTQTSWTCLEKREDGIDFVAITTPNYTHYEIAKSFLQAGINVACDKPLTFTFQEADELDKLAKEKELLFCVTYTYTGYPMVKHAREVVKRGEIGDIRVVIGEYSQDWLATLAEKDGNKYAIKIQDPGVGVSAGHQRRERRPQYHRQRPGGRPQRLERNFVSQWIHRREDGQRVLQAPQSSRD